MTIRFEGFGWRHASRRAWALRDLDLSIETGERVLLLGASGAGKSTLLAALAGLLAEDSGEQAGTVTIGGVHPRERRDRTGILFQDPETQLVMARAGDDVAFGLENRGVPPAEIWPRVTEALRAVGFPYPLDRSTHALSGGEQQRLALAGVLALQPDLLLLDEPTANLDPSGATLVREAINGITGITLILVEHRVAEALPLVDRVIALSPDGILVDGSPRIFETHGETLAQQGIWIPQHPPLSRPSAVPAGEILLRKEDFTVREAEALAVCGPNGSGKTTLALELGGLRKPRVGRVLATPRLAGSDHTRPPHKWRAPALAGRIGSVFQRPEYQFLALRVRDELGKSNVDELLGRLTLDRLADANPWTLSGGEQRRLSVATALADAPSVLVLDEPTFGQDRRTWAELVTLLADLRDEGRAVVAMTHDEDLVKALADRVERL